MKQFTDSSCAIIQAFVFPYSIFFRCIWRMLYFWYKVECTDTFMGDSVALEIDVKACQKPVKISIMLTISSQTFSKEFDGQGDIPLPGLSLGGSVGFVLTVNANPFDNGDLQLEVRC